MRRAEAADMRTLSGRIDAMERRLAASEQDIAANKKFILAVHETVSGNGKEGLRGMVQRLMLMLEALVPRVETCEGRWTGQDAFIRKLAVRVVLGAVVAFGTTGGLVAGAVKVLEWIR